MADWGEDGSGYNQLASATNANVDLLCLTDPLIAPSILYPADTSSQPRPPWLAVNKLTFRHLFTHQQPVTLAHVYFRLTGLSVA